jgi:uncharacterized phage protein (TIGR02220 family)
MQYSFLGFSVLKMMEFKLDMKDVAILRYFIDFRETGRMKAEVIEGKTYYWVNYNSMAEEMPFLELGKRTIMMRMLKLRDLGILTHYTKKEGGTYSFFALGPKYIDLISNTKDNSKEKVDRKIDKPSNTLKGMHENEYGVHQNVEGVCIERNKGCASKCTTKTHLLNNPSTRETLNKKYIKKDMDEIVNYLNSRVGAKYKSNSKNTIKLITARLNEGYSVDDFKTVIDKKFKEWNGTKFEQYLTPQTLFGNKFEQYLNQKIVIEIDSNKNNNEPPKLRFNNFKGRDYDYNALEKKLLGWE